MLIKLLMGAVKGPSYPFWGAVGGAVIGGLFSARGAKRQQEASVGMSREQMDFQAKEASTARDFNERMSSTAYQRGSADMEAAGLNRILAASQGGASSPSSPSPGGAMGVAQNIEGTGIATALAVGKTMADINLTNSQADAITPISTAGKEIGTLWEWLKEKGASTAKQIQDAITEYYYEKSQVTGGTTGQHSSGVSVKLGGNRISDAEYQRLLNQRSK